MVTELAKHWWVLTLRGVLGVLFGIAALAAPFLVGITLVIVYGAYAIVEGIFALMYAFKYPSSKVRWGMLLTGVIALAAGIYISIYPIPSGIAIVYLIAAFAIARGVLEIISAIQVRKQIDNEWYLILDGVLSIICGAVIAYQPIIAAATLIMLLGAFVMIFGFMTILFSLRLRKLNKHLQTHDALGHHHGAPA